MQYRGTKVVMRDGTDPNQQQVRQDMYHAWKDLQALKNKQPGDGHKVATRGNLWRVSSSNGQDKIELLGYSAKEEVTKKRKKTIKTNYGFRPAICMVTTEAEVSIVYSDYDYTGAVLISVCLTEAWEGTKGIVESFCPYDPGMRTADIPLFGLTGLTNHGYSNFSVRTDSQELPTDYVTDSWPRNIDLADPTSDDWENLFEGTVYGAIPGEDCPEVTEWVSGGPNPIPDTECTGSSGLYRAFTLVSSTYTDCGSGTYVDWVTVSNLYNFAFKGYQHRTWAYYYLEHMTVTADVEGIYISGFCRHQETSCSTTTTVDSDGSKTLGAPYTYKTKHDRTWKFIGEVTPTADRPAGNITSGEFLKYSYNRVTKELITPCTCKRTDYTATCTPAPRNYNVGGAYVPSSNSIDTLTDKYIILYSVNASTRVKDLTHYECDYAPSGSSVYTYKRDLYVDINGEILLLDSSTTSGHYFEVTDSHIFSFGTAVYYMYAYSLYKSGYGVMHTVYGYFKDNITQHFQSQEFESAGITTESGYVAVHHDVFGSAQQQPPVYGMGKCSGYSLRILEEIIS